MALFSFNPINRVLSGIRAVIDVAGNLRQPIGAAVARLGRALTSLGTTAEASAIRARIEREASVQGAAHTAAEQVRVGAITDDKIPEATTKLRRRYSYVVKIESLNPLTGQIDTRHVTVSTDTLRSYEEIHGQATEGFAEGYGIKDEYITSITIEGVRKAGPLGTL